MPKVSTFNQCCHRGSCCAMHMQMVHSSQCHLPCWKTSRPKCLPRRPFAQYIGEVSSVVFPRLDAVFTKCKTQETVSPVTMETRCFDKKLGFQGYPPKDFCTARYEHKSSKKIFKLFKNPEKNNSWANLGPRSA